MLRKQQQLAADQEKNADDLLIKQNELDDLRKRFEDEKDPVKKEELRKQMANKQKEIEMLKRHDKLADEQKKKAEVIADKERDLANLRDQLANEKDPIKRAELERLIAEREKEITGIKKDYNINEQKKKADEIRLRENELDNLRKQWENEKDPVKKAELARQMAAKEQEIEMLRKQQQLAADQEKNADDLLIKQNELDDLRKRFEDEKDPV